MTEKTKIGQPGSKGGHQGPEQIGRAYLSGLLDGTAPQPPSARLIGYRLVHLEKDHVVFQLQPSDEHLNLFGTVHGGILSTLLDSAMTAAVLARLDTGFTCSTIEFKVNFIRPVKKAAGVIQSEGRLVNLGKRIATAEARIYDSGRQLYAMAVGTVSVFAHPSP